MTDEHGVIISRIMEKLDNQSKQLDRQQDALINISTTLKDVAIQNEKISALQVQVDALWKKYDVAFAPTGIVFQIKNHQLACPGQNVEVAIGKVWKMIYFLLTLVTGLSMKAAGLF